MDMFVPSNFLEWLITVVFLVTTPIFLLVHLSQTSRARAGQHKKNMNIPKKPPSKTPDTLDTPFLGVLKVPFWGIQKKILIYPKSLPPKPPIPSIPPFWGF